MVSADWRDEYIDKLCSEIESYNDYNIVLDTLFFGGGTPSLLKPYEFEKVCSSIQKTFYVTTNAEFTLEVNPKTLTRENLGVFISCGVNRLSIGLQSIHENELKILGRIHNYADFLDCYAIAREMGINNINIDLMYGIPEQTKDSFIDTLDTVLQLTPEHISLYGLILEEGTPFWNMKNELTIPSEDAECDMYYIAAEKLKSHGYSHYEISNYAKKDYESRHNLKYWRCKEYIGVGAAAYSYLSGERYGNSSNISEYLSENCEKYNCREKIYRDSEMYEYIMLGLRLKEGISLLDYKERFSEDFINKRRSKRLKEYIECGYMIADKNTIALTERGFYISNTILTELL